MNTSRRTSEGKEVNDVNVLTGLNLRFVDAFRRGSWETLQPILSPSFRYLDGTTGELWEMQRYIDDLTSSPQPTIDIDQVVVHVAGDVAAVSARSFTHPDHHNRYIDSYERRDDRWLCFHACVWSLTERAHPRRRSDTG